MNLNCELDSDTLTKMGFTKSPAIIKSNKDAPSDSPSVGALLLCYHKVYGLTVGYWAGHDAYFILPHVRGYNWATHWRYHN
jgi:hypothetical protein